MEEPKRGRGRPKKQTYESLREERKALYHPKKVSGGWMVGKKKLPPCNLLTALLFAFKHSGGPVSKEYLFWEIADLLWNKDEDDPMFAKNKWSHLMIYHAVREKYLSIGGAGSSGKSYVIAGWMVVNWLSSPSDTMVLLTSTDLGGARKRIFGAAMKLLQAVPNVPAKFRESIGVVAYFDGVNTSNTAGIQLIASDKGTAKLGKMIGIKAKYCLVAADELTDISPNVQSAAVGNLSKNEHFQMIGLGNPNSRLDPFGVFSTPKDGWDSVNVLIDYEWKTRLNGKYIRINSEHSPNIDQEPHPEYPTGRYYPYLPTQDSIDEALANMGATPDEARKSREWLRFNAAVFFENDESENVYSEMELIRAGALKRGETPKLVGGTLIASCDPSFSMGGDSTILTFLEVGFDQYRQHVLRYVESMPLFEDSTNRVDPRNLQIAQKIRAACEKRGVTVENFALDASGAGAGLADMLEIVWRPGFLRVQFGGSASSRRIKRDSKVTGKDRYRNRASELFFAGRSYLLGRQLFDIPEEVASEMCNRRFEMSKGPMGMILAVESKKLYRGRVGKSPDHLDSYLVGIELARERQLFMPLDPPATKPASEDLSNWFNNRRTIASYACDKMGHQANL